MNCIDLVELSSDDELGEVDVKPVKLEPGVVGGKVKEKQSQKENRNSNVLSNGNSSSSVLEQGHSPENDTVVSSVANLSPAPVCRQFWKAGNYEDGNRSKVTLQNSKNYLQVHPMFLHSNATSHKWAFGAVAELLDNAIDEIPNGATFVIVDKILNPRDGSPALLIQDDGGGMDPDAMRHCMSFGFSDKKSKSAIGQYGNGFKTSTMRLGADVIVFSRHLNNKSLTQSIGLLSFSFLTRTGHNRIVVPMVDYEFNTSTGTLEVLHGREQFMTNLSFLLEWSPYSTEAELLKQFDDIGSHGTKIIIYNLWFNNDGKLELDFDSDSKDIRVQGETKKIQTLPAWRTVNENHIANKLHYSLRLYLSILYLRVPESFKMVLRGEVVEHHNVVDDLKHIEYILYRPQASGNEGTVVTTIGFLKDAPQVNIHGFCVYHKNRLILPYWQVVNYSDSRGRGVVGALEANFVEPTHNKQDFERTSLFQKLECRLKEMTWEYWDFHCGLIGYLPKKKPRLLETSPGKISMPPAVFNQSCAVVNRTKEGTSSGRTENPITPTQGLPAKRKATQPANTISINSTKQETSTIIQEKKKLIAKCEEYEKSEEELNAKATKLRSELEEIQREYERISKELQGMDVVKEEKN